MTCDIVYILKQEGMMLHLLYLYLAIKADF